MAKYTEDDSTFQIMNDDGSVQSINKADVNPNTIAALKKVNEPLYKEKPEDPNATGFLADIKKAGKITSEGLGGAPVPMSGQQPAPAPIPQAALPATETTAAPKPLSQARISGGLPTAQGAGGQTNPQLSVNTSQVTTTPQQFAQDKKLLDQMKEGADLEQAAVQRKANLDKEIVTAQADLLKHQEIKKVELAETQQKLLEEQRSKIQEAQDKYNTMYEENKNKDFGIFSKDLGNSLLAAVSIGLGAIGGAMTRQGGNVGLDIINKGIEREMETSRERLRNAKENIGLTKSAYDERLASINAQGAAMYDQVAKKAQEMAIKNGSPMAQAQADQMIGALKQKSAMLGQDSLEKLRSKTVTTTAVAEKDVAAKTEKTVPGYGVAGAADDAKQMKAILKDTELAKAGIRDLMKIAETGSSLSPSDRARAQTIQQVLVGQLRVPLTGPGAMSEGDRKLLENAIANPTTVFSLTSSNKIKLKELNKALDRAVAAHAKSFGLSGSRTRDTGAPVK